MRYFVLWDGTQEVSGIGTPYIEKLPLAATGQSWVEITQDIATHTCDATGATTLRPVPLEMAQASTWATAKAYRDTMAVGGCMTPLGRVDTTDVSKLNIVGASSAASIAKASGQPFSVDWTMADNSVVTLDADAMINVGMSVVSFLNSVQTAGTAIRAKIDAATDLITLAGIDITAGYPTN